MIRFNGHDHDSFSSKDLFLLLAVALVGVRQYCTAERILRDHVQDGGLNRHAG